MPTTSCQCAEVKAQRRKVIALEQHIMRLQQELKQGLPREIAEDNPFRLKF
jgi:hypothetical protein